MNQKAWEELKKERDDLQQQTARIELEATSGSDLLLANQYAFMVGYLLNINARIAIETEKRRKFATGEN